MVHLQLSPTKCELYERVNSHTMNAGYVTVRVIRRIFFQFSFLCGLYSECGLYEGAGYLPEITVCKIHYFVSTWESAELTVLHFIKLTYFWLYFSIPLRFWLIDRISRKDGHFVRKYAFKHEPLLIQYCELLNLRKFWLWTGSDPIPVNEYCVVIFTIFCDI